jgi:hypothetical protein
MRPLAAALVVVGAAATCVPHAFGRPCVPGSDVQDCQAGPDATHRCASFPQETGAPIHMCVKCIDRGYENFVSSEEVSPLNPIEVGCDATSLDESLNETAETRDVVIQNTSLEYATLPALVTVFGNIVIADNDALTSIEFPSLKRVDGRIIVMHNLVLDDVVVPDLEELDGGLFAADNAPDVLCRDLFAEAPWCDGGCVCGDRDDPVLKDAGF